MSAQETEHTKDTVEVAWIPPIEEAFSLGVGLCPANEYALKEGVKFDTGKPRWDLLPLSQVEDVVKVLTGGSLKYSDDNWKKIPNIQDRYFAAAMRHLTAQRNGERLDSESGLPHLSHAVCCLLFMAWEEGEPNE